MGAVNGFKTKSWNLASAILLVNSFFIALSLLIIGLILDFNPKLEFIFLIFFLNFILIFIGHFLIKKNLNFFSKLLNQIFNLYFKQDINLKYRGSKITLNAIDKPSTLAWFCLLMGFLFPSILAVIFNEYRSTLFQLSFVFNSVGTLITVLYTDRRASIYTDKTQMNTDEKDDAFNYFIKVINSRLLSTVVLIALLLSLYGFLI